MGALLFSFFVATIIVGIIAWIAMAFNKSAENYLEQRIRGIEDFSADIVFKSGSCDNAIAIDKQNKMIAVVLDAVKTHSKAYNPIVYPFDELIAVEIVKNDMSITKTNRGSQAAGAAIGGALLGPAGLLLGGLSGSKRRESKITNLSLKLYTNDLDLPVQQIYFFDGGTNGVDASSIESIVSEMDQWYGRLRAIIENKHEKTPTQIPSEQPSVDQKTTTTKSATETIEDAEEEFFTRKMMERGFSVSQLTQLQSSTTSQHKVSDQNHTNGIYFKAIGIATVALVSFWYFVYPGPQKREAERIKVAEIARVKEEKKAAEAKAQAVDYAKQQAALEANIKAADETAIQALVTECRLKLDEMLNMKPFAIYFPSYHPNRLQELGNLAAVTGIKIGRPSAALEDGEFNLTQWNIKEITKQEYPSRKISIVVEGINAGFSNRPYAAIYQCNMRGMEISEPRRDKFYFLD